MHQELKGIVFDFDNTIGVPFCDMDDGLALLYAIGYGVKHGLGTEGLIAGLVSAYGNSTLEVVHDNTTAMLSQLGLGLTLHKGASKAGQADSEGGRFIAAAPAALGENERLALSVTGSTTNLLGALAQDADCLSRYDQVVFMGGITETLMLGGRILDELNFSCDPEATCKVFEAANRGAKLYVVTANNCMPAVFTRADFDEYLTFPELPGGGYLKRMGDVWLHAMETRYGMPAFICWDVLVPQFILRPELFDAEPFNVALDPRLLGAGFLEEATPEMPQAPIWLPRIRDARAVHDDALEMWRLAAEALGV